MLKLANKWAKVFLTEPKKCCLSRKPRSISVKVIRIHKMLHPSKQFCSTLSSQPRILLQELKREGIVPRRDFEPRDFVPIRGFDPRDFLPRRDFELRDFDSILLHNLHNILRHYNFDFLFNHALGSNYCKPTKMVQETIDKNIYLYFILTKPAKLLLRDFLPLNRCGYP